MALEIFRLVGSIFVDSDAANKSIGKTDQKAQSVGKTLLVGVKTAAKWGAAIVTGAGVAATAVTGFAKKTAATCDEIDKMSQKIGISREAYQELGFILSQNGMDVNQLQGGMKKLVNTMQDAQNGSSKAQSAFNALGVSAVDGAGALRSQEDVFYDTSSALQAMKNETERNALANDLFGKSASELSPLLNGGAGSMEELRKQAHELGLVLDDEVIDSGVSLTDTLDKLKRAGSAIVTRLGGVVMPLVEKVANYIIDKMPAIESTMDQLYPVITQVFEGLVPPLLDLAGQIFPMIASLLSAIMPILSQILQAIMPVIIELMNTLIPPLVQVVERLLPPLLALLQPILDLLSPIIELLQPILDLVVAVLQPLAELINALLTPLISVISKLVQVALVPLREQFKTLSTVLSNTFNAAVSLVLNAVNTVKGVFSGLIQFIKGVFTGDWKGAWEGVKKIFSSIWEGIKGAFKIPINWIIDGINLFISGLNKLKIPDWVPVVGGKGFHINSIPKLATGGVLEKGQTGFLEGNGAEAVVPLENNRKWIHAVAEDMRYAGIGGSENSEKMLAAILNKLDDIARMGIYLDGERLVGGIAGPMDKKLGQIAVQKART